MRRTILTTAFLLLAASPALACPNCKEANSAAVADGENTEALWWNRSIFMMIGVPFTMIGYGSFYCWKHLKNTPTIGA